MVQPRCNLGADPSPMTTIQSPDDDPRARANVPSWRAGSRASTFTVLFTDSWRRPPAAPAWARTRSTPASEHDDLTIATIDALNGTMVKHTGDGVMALFVGAGDALACAALRQQLLDAATGPQTRRSRSGPDSASVTSSSRTTTSRARGRRGAALCDAADTGHVLCSDLVRAASGTAAATASARSRNAS